MVARGAFRALALAGLLSLAVPAAARADDDDRPMFGLGVRGGPWIGVLHGDVRYPVAFSAGPLGTIGTGTLSTRIDDADVMPYGEAFLTLRWIALYADVWYGRFADDTRAQGTFTFGGVAFGGSTPVRSELRALSAQGRLQVNPIAFDFVEIGASVGARYLDAEGKLTGNDPTTGAEVRASRRIEAPIPQVGLSVTLLPVQAVEIYGRVRGISVRYHDWDIREIEGEVGVALNFGDHLAIGAEYRGAYVSVLDDGGGDATDGLEVVARVQGPLFYLRLRF